MSSPIVTVGIPTYNRSQLLRRAIDSVLAQSYRDFAVIVSDNASDDETAEVVGSYDDPRLLYRPLTENIGRARNFNRIAELSETEFFVMLGDDDELEPDYLARTVEVIKSRPNVGVVHTGFSVIDERGHVLTTSAMSSVTGPMVVEAGKRFLGRSMVEGSRICFSSAMFRRQAFIGGDRLRPGDGVIDDFPLFLRIATQWDFAYVNAPLARLHVHTGASSSALGEFTPRGFRGSRSVPDSLYAIRLTFLAEAGLPELERRRLTRIAQRTYRRDVLAHLSMRARTGDGYVTVLRALRSEIRRDRRLALDPLTGRFIVGLLGGRRVRDGVQHALAVARRGHASNLT